jgi:TIR domain
MYKRSNEVFDIIFLDYLIGDSEEEHYHKAYGHEFLLELSTSPNASQFKRGPYGRFWILPISSFPFAFNDKLRQLNIDGSDERWYISSGGDPITTPALFKLNLYRLIMRQVSESYLHEAALSRQIARYDGITIHGQWCQALHSRLNAVDQSLKILEADRDAGSKFAETFELFLEAKKEYVLDFIQALKGWLKSFNYYQKGGQGQFYLDELKQIGKTYNLASICQQIETKAATFIKDSTLELSRLVPKDKAIVFKREYLYTLPKTFDKNSYNIVENIDLSSNALAAIPKIITNFKSLKSLNLSNNRDLIYIPAQELLDSTIELEVLNLEDTAIGKIIQAKQLIHTTKKLATKRLLESIADYNKRLGLKDMPDKPKDAKLVFISYAHADISWKDEMKKHLRALELQEMIKLWDDSNIMPSETWDARIKEQLVKADIVLFLISADFMASDYIQENEVKSLLEQEQNKNKLIPVYLRPCDLGGHPLSQLNGLPAAGYKNAILSAAYKSPDDGFIEVAQGLRKLVEQLNNPLSNKG